MKELIKPMIALVIITVVAGAALGLVYELTKEPVAVQKEKQKQEAYREVFADAVSFEAEEGQAVVSVAEQYPDESVSDEVVKALDGSGNLIGYVLTVTTHEGYSGDIIFSMGIRLDGTLNGISFLLIAETPGLGMKAQEELKPQFAGKKVGKFVYTKAGATADQEIDAISGATITTNALTNGVNAGLLYFQDGLGGGVNES